MPLPHSGLSSVTGSYVDLERTDTLVWQVFLRRGRILDTSAPWTDPANTSIPMQYVYASYAAAQGHALLGERAEADRHLRRAAAWQGVIE